MDENPNNGSVDDQSVNGQESYLPEPLVIALRAADHILGCYTRHYTGKPRATRDIRLLGEFIELLEHQRRVIIGFPDIVSDHERVLERVIEIDDQLTLLDDEREQIALAAQQVDSSTARALVLAVRLRDQLHWYRAHFTGRTRLSRRPRLLHRIILSLEDIQAELVALEHTNQATDSRQVVADKLPVARNELAAIELMHQSVSTTERIASLCAAAAEEQIEYEFYFADHSGKGGNLDHLRRVCDRLFEIEIQMMDISRQYCDDTLLRAIHAVQLDLDACDSKYAELLAIDDDSEAPES